MNRSKTRTGAALVALLTASGLLGAVGTAVLSSIGFNVSGGAENNITVVIIALAPIASVFLVLLLRGLKFRVTLQVDNVQVTIQRTGKVTLAPGSRLHDLAGFFYSRKTMARVFDPMLADMREEYFETLANGRKWRARWVLLSYYWAFAKVLPIHALVGLGKQVVDLWKLFGSIR